jgi:hypothetical protein
LERVTPSNILEEIMSTNAELYAQDFYAWALTTAALIRAGKWHEVDAASVAEEVESVGASEYRAVSSAIYQILVHLLKWRYQPQRQSRSWQSSLVEHRNRVPRGLRHAPSLTRELPTMLLEEYPAACRKASAQTGLSLATFPAPCPWSLEQVLNPDFLPEGEPTL